MTAATPQSHQPNANHPAGQPQSQAPGHDRARQVVTVAVCVLGAVFNLALGLESLAGGKVTQALPAFSATVLLLGITLWAWAKPTLAAPRWIATILAMSGFLHALLTGTADGTGILWSLLVPACGVYLLGLRDGIIACGLYMVLCLWVLFGAATGPHMVAAYGLPFVQRFVWIGTVSAIVAISFEYERVRVLRRLEYEITHAKTIENELRLSEETARKLSRAVEQSPATVLITNLDGTIEYVNPKFTETTGYLPEEALGKNPRVLKSGDMGPESYREMWEAVSAGREWRGEFHNRRKNGELYWEHASISAIRDATGAVTHYLAVKEDITARKATEQALRKSEEALRALYENAPIGIFTSLPSGRYQSVNPYYAAIYGFPTPDEMVQTITDIPSQIYTDPKDRHALLETVALQNTVENYMVRRKTRDNEERWVSLNMRAVRSPSGEIERFEGFCSDITQRKQAETALRQATERFERMAMSVPLALYDYTECAGTGWYQYFSPRCQDIFELTPAELTGPEGIKTFLSLIHPEDYPRQLENHTQAIRYGTQFSVLLRIVPSSGRIRWVQFMSRPGKTDATGCRVWSGFALDVTERVRSEEALREANQQLAHTTERAEALAMEAEEASRAKGEFLANMSHEIRTPMNAIIGLSHLALRTNPSAVLADSLKKINSSARSLLGILNDILDFSKIEAGMLTVERISFNLEDVLDEVASVLSVQAGEKGLELLVGVCSDVPLGLVGDPLRLGQVLVNLAGNAIKFTQKGEVRITVAAQEPLPEDSGTQLLFSVRDTGIGMTPEQQRRLFQPFTQADASTTRRFGGTGLGLSISRRLVQLMDGDIHVTSQAGVGSIFSFTVNMGLDQQAGPTPRELPQGLRAKRLLLVDDSPAAREMLQECLTGMDLPVDMAENGPQALEMISAATNHPYDLLLLDWKMPEMDGFEVVRHLAAALPPGAARPKVIMLTAHGRDMATRQPGEEDIAALLMKPVNPSTLFNTIMRIFGEEEKIQASHSTSGELAAEQAARLRGARVLLVEDNAINQQVGQGILEGAGMLVSLANNGRAALRMLAQAQAGPHPYNAVLMDIQMPEMDGYEATGVIRSDATLAQLPVIAMTAHAMRGDRERVLASGMDDYVTKPIEPRALYATLARWLPDRSENSDEEAKAGQAEPNQNAQQQTETQAEKSQLPAQLPGINVAEGLERLLGDAELYRSVLIDLRDSGTERAQHIRQTLEHADHAQARSLVHALRGAAANLSATGLTAAALALEEALEGVLAGNDPTHARVAELGRALEDALLRLTEDLREL